VLKASADAIWNLARETNLNVFAVNWAGPPQTDVDQNQDNAACMGLSLYASLAGAYPGSGIPANQYEAENATIHNLALEANGTGFTGWGYVASWNANNQSVDFKVNFPNAGGRTLTFRYATGAGNASRVITINGTNVVTNQSFAGTGSWSTYNNVNVSYHFPAGFSTISVKFTSSLGSTNYLNLDNLVVTELRITNMSRASDGTIQLTWNSVSGVTYRLQYTASLTSPNWTNLGGAITATGATTSATDSPGSNTARYYRVIIP
jgi:hypothetical protein